jgi:hypothetical protein
MVGFMPEFKLPLSERDREWIALRERFARAARDMHFVAVSNDAVNGAMLLAVAGSLAELAMSIPLSPAPVPGLVDSSTLLATQILQLRQRPDCDGTVIAEWKE